MQGSRLIPVLAQTPGRDLSNTKGSVQRPELNLWFSLVKVQLAEAYSQYGARTFWCIDFSVAAASKLSCA